MSSKSYWAQSVAHKTFLLTDTDTEVGENQEPKMIRDIRRCMIHMKSNIIHRITNFEFQNIVVIDNKKGITQYCFGLIGFDVIHKITFWQKSLAPSADHIKCSKPRVFLQFDPPCYAKPEILSTQ